MQIQSRKHEKGKHEKENNRFAWSSHFFVFSFFRVFVIRIDLRLLTPRLLYGITACHRAKFRRSANPPRNSTRPAPSFTAARSTTRKTAIPPAAKSSSTTSTRRSATWWQDAPSRSLRRRATAAGSSTGAEGTMGRMRRFAPAVAASLASLFVAHQARADDVLHPGTAKLDPPTLVLSVHRGWMPRYSAAARASSHSSTG